MERIPLFDHERISTLNEQQSQLFAGVLYHIRGYLHDFIWHLINIAPNKHFKRLLIENIVEESGGDGLSHECLYGFFASELGIDIRTECYQKRYYYSFVREFNDGHLKWLATHNFAYGFSAYSAYECLDNVDYLMLVNAVKGFGVSKRALAFFELHSKVLHYETTASDLADIWERDPKAVISGYEFIFSHQLRVWRGFSDLIFPEQVKAIA